MFAQYETEARLTTVVMNSTLLPRRNGKQGKHLFQASSEMDQDSDDFEAESHVTESHSSIVIFLLF